MNPDYCVDCGEELALFEKNRAECWACRDKASEAYSDDILMDESAE